MDIRRQYLNGAVELAVTGRLDGYWSEHLARAIDDEVRQGSHHVLLDLSEVGFLSSAGIGVLVKFYRELRSIHGSLSIWKASERVRKVIELCGLKDVLLSKTSASDRTANGELSVAVEPEPVAQIETQDATFEVHMLDPERGLTCSVLGSPDLLAGCRFEKESCRTLEFPDSTFAIGLGALGANFEECQSRFGEFISVAGAAAYLPTDGTNMPDYLVGAGESAPEVHVCYCIVCQARNAGLFSKLVRFEAKRESGAVTLSHLVESCLRIAKSRRIGMVMIAEAAGLMGAALRQSPAQQKRHAPFEFPQVREWLTFTAERAHTRSTALVAGIAIQETCQSLAAMVRPLSSSAANKAGPIAGHFHAAAFSYRPLPKGEIDLKHTVRRLFEGQTLESVLHLLRDDRAMVGAGESEFIRGACWIGSIHEIAPETEKV